MNERDRFLTEVMGECWHQPDFNGVGDYIFSHFCAKCKLSFGMSRVTNNDFSTWDGFGKLWNWVQQQKWNIDFFHEFGDGYSLYRKYLNPDNLADALYKFLKDK